MRLCYKIIDVINGQPKFLYYGINRTKNIPFHKYLCAVVKQVKDGKGTSYKSGFHVFLTEGMANKYLKKFVKPHKRIALVYVNNAIRKKRKNGDVYLAKTIKFMGLV